MKKILFLTFLLMTSLTVFAQQKRVNYSQARLLDVTSDAYIKPAVADLIVDKSFSQSDKDYQNKNGRVRFRGRLSKDQAEKDLDGSMENIRSYIVFMACEKYNCDVILGGTFNIRSAENPSDGYDFTMYGFPANFENWRLCTKEDYDWMILKHKVDRPDETREKTSPVRK